MDLKNAVAVCLISLFSASLVVMIARALDSQAASRIEPQLAQIVEELQALRKSGGIAALPTSANGAAIASDEVDNGSCLLFSQQYSLRDLSAIESAVARGRPSELRPGPRAAERSLGR